MPPELLAGHWMAVAPNGTSLFVATKDSRCVVWSLGFRAPEGHAAELSAVFKDQSRTQVESKWLLEQVIPATMLPRFIRCC